MSDTLIPVSKDWRERALIDRAKYEAMYAQSVNDPDGFWREQAKRIDWIKPFTKVKNVSWDSGQSVHQMVRGRHAERLGELHRPPSAQARQTDGDHLGRR